MASCGYVPRRPSRSGSVWLRTQCFSVTVRLALNGMALFLLAYGIISFLIEI